MACLTMVTCPAKGVWRLKSTSAWMFHPVTEVRSSVGVNRGHMCSAKRGRSLAAASKGVVEPRRTRSRAGGVGFDGLGNPALTLS